MTTLTDHLWGRCLVNGSYGLEPQLQKRQNCANWCSMSKIRMFRLQNKMPRWKQSTTSHQSWENLYLFILICSCTLKPYSENHVIPILQIQSSTGSALVTGTFAWRSWLQPSSFWLLTAWKKKTFTVHIDSRSFNEFFNRSLQLVDFQRRNLIHDRGYKYVLFFWLLQVLLLSFTTPAIDQPHVQIFHWALWNADRFAVQRGQTRLSTIPHRHCREPLCGKWCWLAAHASGRLLRFSWFSVPSSVN